MDHPISGIRREYALRGLSERDAAADPFKQFDVWFDEAVRAGLHEPNAMALATVDTAGQPSVRLVLLKGFDQRGVVFYTNYNSRKARELADNRKAALCFWWPELERQVRIEGVVEKVSPEESDAYFQSRPREAQLGAAVSDQSHVLESREALERRFWELESHLRGKPVPRPASWGGLRLQPHAFEFWQGRPHRLHDRLRYTRQTDGNWKIERLAP